MTTLREAAQNLHDKIDDLNAEVMRGEALCIICKALSYNGVEDIEHTADCILAILRRILSEDYDETTYLMGA